MPSAATTAPCSAGRSSSGRTNRSTMEPVAAPCSVRLGTFTRAAPSATVATAPSMRSRRAQHVDVADERRDETVDRPAVDLVRGAELVDATLGDHGNPVRQTERLALVVRDENGRHAELALNFLELDLHRGAQVPIERRERLVK